MSNPSITADKTPWYQWDTGLTVTVSGGAMTECHFANRKQGTAYVQAVINGIARVPDELLQVAAPIKAYGYVSDGAGCQTYVEQTFEVIARNIPADYTYTKTAQKTIRDAETARDEAVQAAKDAKSSELAADDSAVEASKSAQSAGESASAASTSASNAAKSAGEAAKSASEAKAAASKTVEDASDLLKTYTDNAKTSADNAATSASNAANAASEASGSASAAAQSATDASNAKVAAQTAKGEAEAAKSEAATSASNADSSAKAAAKSASDAAASVGAINVIAPKKVKNDASSVPTSIAIGDGVKANFINSVNVGGISKGSYSTVVGIGAEAHQGANASVAIGYQSIAFGINQFAVGGPERQREIVGVKDPTYKTSASTKKYTDDNDAKTLAEAKKYTDANTSNALVGTVSGKLLHVEDAWPSKPLSLTIDGSYKQVTTIGKNLLNGCDSYFKEEDSEHKNYLWGYSLGNNPLVLDKPLEPGTYTFSIYTTKAFYIYLSKKPYVVGDYASFAANKIINDDTRFGLKRRYGTFTVNDTYELVGIYSDKYQACFGGMIEKDKTVSAYEPYTAGKPSPNPDYPQEITVVENPVLKVTGADTSAAAASLPITLPAEHPYLAALPDGTHDEIVIDKDGNASLVARVGKTETSATEGVNATIGTDALSSTGALADGATVYYKLANVVTYHLGKLDIPPLPETISNVWVDAELTTNMSMTYKRDINIAFDNLVQAVVAAAAGE